MWSPLTHGQRWATHRILFFYVKNVTNDNGFHVYDSGQVTVYAEKEGEGAGEVLEQVDNVHWVYGRKISEWISILMIYVWVQITFNTSTVCMVLDSKSVSTILNRSSIKSN